MVYSNTQSLAHLNNRLDKVLSKLESDGFLHNQGLGNEIGFYIFDYPAQYELLVREHIDFICQKLSKFNRSFCSINLFDVVLEMLESRDLLECAFELHKSRGDQALFKALKGPLEQSRVAQFIAAKIDSIQPQFILLHGLGSSWPMIRGHELLAALHAKLGDIPTVLFYPGEYDNTSLKAFGKIQSNNYYRAFNLVP